VTCRFRLDDKEKPVQAKGDIKPPKLIKKVDPIYPEEARKEGISGVVILEVTTDEFGEVKSTEILRSVPALDQAAIDAVEQWIYEPMIIEGKPKSVAFTVTVRFRLNGKERKILKEPETEQKKATAAKIRKILEDESAVRIEGDQEKPNLIKKVDPIYPEEARKEGIKGKVLLEVTTDTVGRVDKIKILKSIPGLDEAAVDAVKQWVYEPYIIDGKPKGAIFTVTVQFHLN
jgi:protein TonB